MSDEFTVYICDQCKKTSRVGSDDPIPMCCGKLMTRLQIHEKDDNKQQES